MVVLGGRLSKPTDVSFLCNSQTAADVALRFSGDRIHNKIKIDLVHLEASPLQQCWCGFGATLKTQTVDQTDNERPGRDVECCSEKTSSAQNIDMNLKHS